MPATFLVDLKNQLHGDVSVCQTFDGTTAGHEGNAVDMQLSDGPLFGVLAFGSVTGSSVDVDVKLQECDTSDGNFTDCTNGAFTASYSESTADNVLEVVNARRTKRWARAHVVIAGTVTSVPVTVLVAAQKKILGGDGAQVD